MIVTLVWACTLYFSRAFPLARMYTLVELLHTRAVQSSRTVTFLDDDGHIESVLSYAELYSTALSLAHALHSSGLRPGNNNVVMTNFSDARHHILTFWACCIGVYNSNTPGDYS
jgi:acyl-CoA synthetase (AMP-forming)/AMP-acid ligase II